MNTGYKILGLMTIVGLTASCLTTGIDQLTTLPKAQDVGGGVSLDSLDGATNVSVSSSFYKVFTSEVDTSAVTTATFFIVPTPNANIAAPLKAAYNESTCNISNALPATVSCLSTIQCTLDPDSDLSYGTGYTACLTAGAMESHSFTTEASALSVSSVKDANGATVNASGSTGIIPTSFEITFSEAMDRTSVTTAGNITLACGSLTPSITVAASETANTYTVTVTDAWRYAMMDCTLTISTNVKNASGTALALAAYSFTNACALNDDFNADTRGCWEVKTLGNFTTLNSWSDILSHGLSFNPTNGTLDYDASEEIDFSRFVIGKNVNVSSSGFEIIIHFRSVSGFDFQTEDDKDLALVLLGEEDISPNIMGIMENRSGQQVCDSHIEIPTINHDPSRAIVDCSGDSEYYIKFSVDANNLSRQYSTDGVNYDGLTLADPPNNYNFTADEVMSNFLPDANLILWIVIQNSDNDTMAQIDEIITTGITPRTNSAGQY